MAFILNPSNLIYKKLIFLEKINIKKSKYSKEYNTVTEIKPNITDYRK